MKKAFVASLTGAALLVGISSGVYAGTNLKKIEAYLNGDLKVRVNGKVAQFNDDKGLALQPITYKGNVYVPIKGIGSALNVPVVVDDKNKQVVVGEKVNGTPVKSEPFHNTNYSKDPQQTTYKGVNYKEVLFERLESGGGPSFFFTPNKKYQKLVLKIAAIDEELKDVQISDLNANALLKDVGTISPEDGLKEIEVDIGGVKTVAVNLQVSAGGAYMVPLIASYYK
ncbi:hypothetical protein [Cohnella sp. REN36]|uniref:hypothetical protein n=1 Tax=Cohnella sp. REN36 TaxID=2887347 RepID=UPI001D1406AC|nr:hypothetical protein [Cohnella sp. REN36]MCC3372480.1 hypothetical protein [Cohnella sp. REN36]